MSNTINLVLPFNDTNVELVKGLLAKADLSTSPNSLKVVDAEVVEPKAPAKKAAAKPASKKAPEPEPEDEEFELEDEAAEEEGVTLDDIKELQATKVQANREAIIKKLKGYGPDVKGPATIPTDKYQDFYDFLSKLK